MGFKNFSHPHYLKSFGMASLLLVGVIFLVELTLDEMTGPEISGAIWAWIVGLPFWGQIILNIGLVGFAGYCAYLDIERNHKT